MRYPIILPRNHCVSRLIIKHAHEQTHQGGINQVLSELSTHYWIISAREAIKEWERACMQCRRRRATPGKQIMAALPELPTQMSLRAFSQTSVNFGGPFITKQGSSLRASSPVWARKVRLARTRERGARFTRPNRRASRQGCH